MYEKAFVTNHVMCPHRFKKNLVGGISTDDGIGRANL